MKRKVSYLEFDGIQIPYTPSTVVTKIVSGGTPMVEEVLPPYIQNWKSVLTKEQKGEMPSIRAITNGVLSLEKAICIELVQQSSLQVRGLEAPVAVSAEVPVDCCYYDREAGRVVLNEEQAAARAIDADGDHIVVIENEDRSQAVLVKWPIVMRPLIVIPQEQIGPERFRPFGLKQCQKLLAEQPVKEVTPEEVKAAFMKNHTIVPVGLYTNAWNSADLYYCHAKKLSFAEKMQTIYNTYIDPILGVPRRFVDIELGGLKGVRKDHLDIQIASILSPESQIIGAGYALDYQYAWALTGANGIGGLSSRQTEWVAGADLPELMKSITQLDVNFREVRPLSALPPSVHRFCEGGLLKRLLHLKLIRYKEIPHADPSMPPSVLLWLSLPTGEPIGLTDVKRGNVGFTYGFLLPPVYDNVDIYKMEQTQDKENVIAIAATKKWEHPMNHLGKMLTTFNSLLNYGNDVFPRTLEQWYDPTYAIKVDALYKWLLDYASKYGDPAPATKVYNDLVPNPLAVGLIARSVMIDYGRDCNALEMWQVATQAHKLCNFCMAGSKSDDPRLRKYMLANNVNQGTCLDPKGLTSIHRGAKNRSQLIRALKKIKMTVAIVDGYTETQIHITKSGVEKQLTNEAFLPQVFTTEAEYLEFCELIHKTPEEFPAQVINYKTWKGETRRCWVLGGNKTSIEIGKLVDQYGNKFMPRLHKATHARVDGKEVPIDLLFPIGEMLAKSTHHIYLQNAKPGRLVLPEGGSVDCMVVEASFYRTGAPSENTPVRSRSIHWKGMDSYPIEARLREIGVKLPDRYENIDFTLAQEMQTALVALREKYASVLAPATDEEEPE